MDTLDRKILQVLQADSRTSLQDIGQSVGLSPSPCWGRVKKMEEAGVIEGIRHSKSSFVLRTLKKSDLPLLP